MNAEIIAVILLNACFAIKYVRQIFPSEKSTTSISEKRIIFKFNFHRDPRINGKPIGLIDSHNPEVPKEYKYFPIPI